MSESIAKADLTRSEAGRIDRMMESSREQILDILAEHATKRKPMSTGCITRQLAKKHRIRLSDNMYKYAHKHISSSVSQLIPQDCIIFQKTIDNPVEGGYSKVRAFIRGPKNYDRQRSMCTKAPYRKNGVIKASTVDLKSKVMVPKIIKKELPKGVTRSLQRQIKQIDKSIAQLERTKAALEKQL